MMPTATGRLMTLIEEAGYQFLQDKATGRWALFDTDDRSKVFGSEAKGLGDSVWASAASLNVFLTDD